MKEKITYTNSPSSHKLSLFVGIFFFVPAIYYLTSPTPSSKIAAVLNFLTSGLFLLKYFIQKNKQ
jgi:hypothetical protein